MAKKKKWEIDDLDEDKSLTETAKIVLTQKIKILEISLKKYFKNDSVNNLHEVRIAIRRLRYNMEIFLSCFNRKKYLKFYKTIVHLQDLTGSKRDYDVLLQNIEKLSSAEQIERDENLNNIIKDKISHLKETLKIEFVKFLESKEYKDFQKLFLK